MFYLINYKLVLFIVLECRFCVNNAVSFITTLACLYKTSNNFISNFSKQHAQLIVVSTLDFIIRDFINSYTIGTTESPIITKITSEKFSLTTGILPKK